MTGTYCNFFLKIDRGPTSDEMGGNCPLNIILIKTQAMLTKQLSHSNKYWRLAWLMKERGHCMMHSWWWVGIKRRGRRGGCGGRLDNAYTECVCCLFDVWKKRKEKRRNRLSARGPDQIHAKRLTGGSNGVKGIWALCEHEESGRPALNLALRG